MSSEPEDDGGKSLPPSSSTGDNKKEDTSGKSFGVGETVELDL